MQVTITTGVRYTPTPTVFTVEIDDVEINPEQVFEAANRIDDLPEDERGLAHAWQRRIRRALDEYQAPSMSGGDSIELCTNTGVYLGGWRCDSIGWSTIEVAQ